MSDWSKPALTDTYANFLSFLSNRLNDLAVGNEAALVTLTSPPTNTQRWNAASSKWQLWNGTTWGDLTATYSISISGNAATATTASAVPWSGITSKPTTVAGYAISDALTTSVAASTYAPIASPTFTGTTTIADSAGTAYPAGFLYIPQVGGAAKTTNYTAVLADANKSILFNATTLTGTIPANSSVAYPIGTVLIFDNTFAGNLLVAITTDTMTLAGTTTVGTRTIAQNGSMTARKITATSWLAMGVGVT